MKTFKVERDSNEDDYDVNNVLESLGELDKACERKVKTGNGNAKTASNVKPALNGTSNPGKSRRNSSDKSNDEFDDKKSLTDDSSTISSAELMERSASRNSVQLDEADLKTQISRLNSTVSYLLYLHYWASYCTYVNGNEIASQPC